MSKLFMWALLICVFGLKTQAQTITVVIDPGHGGKDPGHESVKKAHLAEKDLNLTISKILGNYLETKLQNIKVVYTRTSDVFLSLDERVAKANTINADIFISIHCNGSDSETTKGTETHVHSLSSKKSTSLASLIEKEFASRASRKSRGIKNGDDRSHSIQVLKHTKMTSVLIECGFLTNVTEANFLNSTYGQEIIASAVFRGIRAYVQDEYPKIEFVKTEKPEYNYEIQIMSSIKPVDVKSSHFKKLKNQVTRKEIITKSIYKYIYITGSYNTLLEAEESLKTIKTQGFKDAFILKIKKE